MPASFSAQDVPLFLPLYGYARVYDLRKIALEENARNVRMDGYVRAVICRDTRHTHHRASSGLSRHIPLTHFSSVATHHHSLTAQMDFNSGFEWGYWLNSLIAARAAWAPGDTVPDPY